MAYTAISRRRQHFTDRVNDADVRQRRRQIRNWSNFREPGGMWEGADPRAELATGAPDGWSGTFDFRHVSRRGALQTYFGDTTTPRIEPLVGCRVAGRRGAWLNWKAWGHDTNVDAEVLNGGRRVQWRNLWPNTHLRYRVAAHKLVKTIRIVAAGGPTSFEFTARIPAGYTLEIANNAGRLLDDRGIEVMRLESPWGRDSATLNPNTIDGHNPIGVTMEDGGTRTINSRTYRVVRLVLDAGDMAGAVYPVTVDPTTVISGTAAIEDNWLRGRTGQKDNNFGGFGFVAAGRETSALWFNNIVSRIINPGTTIPAGNITAFRHVIFQQSNGASQRSGTMSWFILKDANATWVEGTASGTTQTGSSDFTHAVHATTEWAGGGSNRPGVSGTDFDADASPPTHTYSAYTSGPDIGPINIALPAAWAIAWRDATRLNAGLVVFGEDAVVDSLFVSPSTEDTASQPTFEIDFAAGAVPFAALFRPIGL